MGFFSRRTSDQDDGDPTDLLDDDLVDDAPDQDQLDDAEVDVDLAVDDDLS